MVRSRGAQLAVMVAASLGFCLLCAGGVVAWPAGGEARGAPSEEAVGNVAATENACPGMSIATGGAHCLCPASSPVCVGPNCVTGYYKSTKGVVQGFHRQCQTCACHTGNVHSDGDVLHIHPPTDHREGLSKKDAAYWRPDGKPRVLVMTVATHREPFIELLEQSVANLGLTLHVAGLGEFFKGVSL